MKNDKVEFSARASLVAYGARFQQLGIWQAVRRRVKIKQKTRQHTPLEKLLDALINILADGAGMVEVNTRVRPAPAVQHAFGRRPCAEQATISETLNACTPENSSKRAKPSAPSCVPTRTVSSTIISSRNCCLMWMSRSCLPDAAAKAVHGTLCGVL